MIKRQDLDPKNTKIEIKAIALKHLLSSFEADYGTDELNRFMDKTGLPAEYFENQYNWVSFGYLSNFLKELVNYSRDEKIAFKYGLNIIKYADALGIWKIILTFYPSVSYIIKTLVKTAPRLSKVGNVQIIESGKNKAIIELKLFNGYKQDKNRCLHLLGQYSAMPTVLGLPYANVKELRCAADGADSCIYEITWQNYPLNKKKFFLLFISLLITGIIFSVIRWNIISLNFLAMAALLLIPALFYLGGHILDYKRTIKENFNSLNEQNLAVIDSLNKAQLLNEALQMKIDQRTIELKAINNKLDSTLLDLRDSEQKLIRSERMAGIANLAAGVAHEINNPLGAVRNYLQEIIEEMPEDDPRKANLVKSENATKDCKTLINDLLSFARTEKNLAITKINLNEVINRITYNVQHTFPYLNIKIFKDLELNLPLISFDQMQINQVFTNLIINSYKAINEKGEIHLKTSSNENEILAEIQDNGEIIPKEMINDFFNSFDRTMEGIGRKDLGLIISHNIVKRFNGDIKINSSAENGTTFTVALPYKLKNNREI